MKTGRSRGKRGVTVRHFVKPRKYTRNALSGPDLHDAHHKRAGIAELSTGRSFVLRQ